MGAEVLSPKKALECSATVAVRFPGKNSRILRGRLRLTTSSPPFGETLSVSRPIFITVPMIDRGLASIQAAL